MKITIRIICCAIVLLSLFACQMKIWSDAGESDEQLRIRVERFDRLQSRFINTGDFAALQQMNTNYPMETRMLIENVLQLGTVDQPNMEKVFRSYFQDRTLQKIIASVDEQYAVMDDINDDLSRAMTNLQRWLPEVKVPTFYAQIGSLDQSIIVGDGMVGISLDKYLGENYQPYKRFYPQHQLKMMNRENIVPDCLTFYLLYFYPLENFETASQKERDKHIAKVFYVINKAMDKHFFANDEVEHVEQFMQEHPEITIQQLLKAK